MKRLIGLLLCALAVFAAGYVDADVAPPLELSMDTAGAMKAGDGIMNLRIGVSVPAYAGSREAGIRLVLTADGIARVSGQDSWTIAPVVPGHSYQLRAAVTLNGAGLGHARLQATSVDSAGRELWGRAQDVFLSRTTSDVLIGKSSHFELLRSRLDSQRSGGTLNESQYRQQLRELLQGPAAAAQPRASAIAAAAPTFATVTVSGTATYTQRTNVDAAGANTFAAAADARAIAGAVVTFFDNNTGTGVVTPLTSTPASVVTDSTGAYSATVPGVRGDGSAVNLVVAVSANSSAGTIGPIGIGTHPELAYQKQSAPAAVGAATMTVNLLVDNTTPVLLNAFAIREGMLTAYNFVIANDARTGVGVDPATIYIEYPGDSANGSYFSTDNGDHLNIGQNHGFDWDVYTHEYGHYVQKLNGTTQNPGGTHYICTNSTGLPQKSGRILNKDQGIKLAWGEGWPTFFGTNLQIASGAGAFGIYGVGDTVYTDTANKFHYDLEDNSDHCQGAGEDSELSVQRILWDFADEPSDGHDAIVFGTDEMWKQLNGGSKPVTLDQFRVLFNGLVPPSGGGYDTGTPAQNQIRYGRIYFDHNVGPEPLTPADNAASATPPQFSWNTKGAGYHPTSVGVTKSYHFNKFNVVFFNKDYSKVIFTSPEIPTAAGALSADGLTANWTPTADQWTTITGGDALIHWVVQGSNDTLDPATGPYYGLDRTIGGLSIVFVIDDTGSMSDDIDGVREGLTDFITELRGLTPPAKPLIEVITFKDDVTRRIVSNDLDQIQAVVNSLTADGGGDCPEASAEALAEALVDLPSGAGVGKIIFATDASPHAGYSLEEIESQIRSKGIGITELLTGDCDPDGGITGMASATAATVAPRLPRASPRASQNPGYNSVLRGGTTPAVWPNDVVCDPDCALSIGAGAPMSPNILKLIGDPDLTVPSSVASFSAIANSSPKGTLLFLPQVKSGDLTGYTSAVTNAALGAVVPTVISANPAVGYPASSVDVSITGGSTNFGSGSTVSFSGGGITVNSVKVLSATQLVANISIAAGAAVGQRNVVVTTPLGPSVTETTKGGGQFSVGTASAPLLASILPAQVALGTTPTISVSGVGTHFDATSTVSIVDPTSADPGVTVGAVTVASPTALTVSVTVAPGAAVGFRNFTINTGSESASLGGGGLLVVASIAPPPALPVLTSVTPNSGAQGSGLDLAVVGSNTHFTAGSTVASLGGSGVTVASTSVSGPTQATVHINIDPAAPLGYHDVVLTTGSEVATAVSGFAVTAASAPTVTISVNPGVVTAGASASLTWSSTNAASCAASGAWTGAEPASGNQAVSPTAAGSYTYTLTCTGSGGGSAAASATLTVNAAPLTPVSTSAGGGAAAPGLLGVLGALAWLRRARKRRLAAMVAAACVAAAPAAQALRLDEFLGGVRAGAVTSNIGNGVLTQELRAKGYNVQAGNGSTGAGETVYVGYSPIGHLDLLLSYTHTDAAKVTLTGTSPASVQQLLRDAAGLVTGYGGDAYALSARLHGELLPGLSLGPRVGILLVSTHTTLDSGAVHLDETHQRGGLTMGVGLQYRVWRGLNVGGGVDYYRTAGDRHFTLGEGEVEWRFGQ
ncbi:MAG: hypothetical protein P4L83_15355 [Nevskia sp.]|nr:hypothetical protein [Nevskia sp.]